MSSNYGIFSYNNVIRADPGIRSSYIELQDPVGPTGCTMYVSSGQMYVKGTNNAIVTFNGNGFTGPQGVPGLRGFPGIQGPTGPSASSKPVAIVSYTIGSDQIVASGSESLIEFDTLDSSNSNGLLDGVYNTETFMFINTSININTYLISASVDTDINHASAQLKIIKNKGEVSETIFSQTTSCSATVSLVPSDFVEIYYSQSSGNPIQIQSSGILSRLTIVQLESSTGATGPTGTIGLTGPTGPAGDNLIINSIGSNRILISDGTSNSVNAQPNLTFNGSVLNLTGDINMSGTLTMVTTYTSALTVSATTTNPILGATTINRTTATMIGDKKTITVRLGWAAGTAGTGQYILNLPSGVSFNTAANYNPTYTSDLVWSPSVSVMTPYLIPASGKVVTSGAWSSGIYIVPYSSTTYRILTDNAPAAGGFGWWDNTYFALSVDGLIVLQFDIWN
jgi:collagen type VII alpha